MASITCAVTPEMSFPEPSEIQLGWFSHCFVNHGSKWLHLKHSWKATAWPCKDLAGLAKANAS